MAAMAEAMAENELHEEHCCCDHGRGHDGALELSAFTAALNDLQPNPEQPSDAHRNAHVRKPHLKNGCLKAKLARNGISKLTEQSQGRHSCCGGSVVQQSDLSCGDVDSPLTQSCTSLGEPPEGDTVAACSSIESCSKTESELSDALISTSISELSGSDSGRDMLNGIEYVVYESELQMPDIMRLITKDLSEPYSIYTYRYFIHNWPKLCFLAMDSDKCVGAIVCKLDLHKKMVRRGYIAMLAVDKDYRRRKIGSHLVMKAIRAMISDDCDEVVLETEITNKSALLLYENLGFVRDKRLFRYYLNGVDALRLKLWLR